MTNDTQTSEQLLALLGEPLFAVWNALCARIGALYDMDCLLDHGGKSWTFERKYRRGGKTLCALYAREGTLGMLVIFGKTEREAFEVQRAAFSAAVQTAYDEATTYHDGKWVMFRPADTLEVDELAALLRIKRKPNRKQA